MAKKRSSRQALIESATSTLANHPGASLEEIASQAGIGRATLHRHFGSRDGLIRELTRLALDETDQAMTDIPVDLTASDTLKAVLEAVVPLGDRFHFLAQEFSVLKDPEISERLERQLDELRRLVEAVRSEGKIASDVSDAWVVATLDALIYAAWASVEEGWVARREAPMLVFRTVFKGLGSE